VAVIARRSVGTVREDFRGAPSTVVAGIGDAGSWLGRGSRAGFGALAETPSGS
jgi:hypothetical protein